MPCVATNPRRTVQGAGEKTEPTSTRSGLRFGRTSCSTSKLLCVFLTAAIGLGCSAFALSSYGSGGVSDLIESVFVPDAASIPVHSSLPPLLALLVGADAFSALEQTKDLLPQHISDAASKWYGDSSNCVMIDYVRGCDAAPPHDCKWELTYSCDGKFEELDIWSNGKAFEHEKLLTHAECPSDVQAEFEKTEFGAADCSKYVKQVVKYALTPDAFETKSEESYEWQLCGENSFVVGVPSYPELKSGEVKAEEGPPAAAIAAATEKANQLVQDGSCSVVESKLDEPDDGEVAEWEIQTQCETTIIEVDVEDHDGTYIVTETEQYFKRGDVPGVVVEAFEETAVEECSPLVKYEIKYDNDGTTTDVEYDFENCKGGLEAEVSVSVSSVACVFDGTEKKCENFGTGSVTVHQSTVTTW